MRAGGETAAFAADMSGQAMHAPAPVAAPALTLERAYQDLETILYSTAVAPARYRNFAVHYMRCRDVLLGGPDRAALPGFLIQCGTSERFREFILLYDAAPQARHAFLDQALGRCRAAFGLARSFDIFDDEDF